MSWAINLVQELYRGDECDEVERFLNQAGTAATSDHWYQLLYEHLVQSCMASDNGFASFPSSLGFNQVDIQSSLFWLGNDTLEAPTSSQGYMMLTPQQPAAGGMCYLLPPIPLASKLKVQPHLIFFRSRSSIEKVNNTERIQKEKKTYVEEKKHMWTVGSSLKSDWS